MSFIGQRQWARRLLAALVICCSLTAISLPASAQSNAGYVVPPQPATDADAARFLQQATFGFSDADVALVKSIGYSAWIDRQIALPIQFSAARDIQARQGNWYNTRAGAAHDAIWRGLIRNDQLRQRMAFALSQIMVNSTYDGSTEYWGRALAKYWDNFYVFGFTTHRQLLEAQTLNPAMAQFLSYNYNSKENATTGSQPDQNFAREVMQLFTIGLYRLNLDGSRMLDSNNQPIESYSTNDIIGISRVMTGLAPVNTSAIRWNSGYCFCQQESDIKSQISPLTFYNQYHSVSQKSFLGTVISAGSSDTRGDLKVLLDRLSGHPNVGPFLGKQLIQRFVTSNPSPAYIDRVSRVFNDNGTGVRGDMKAVIKAVLLDPEARDPASVAKPDFGRIREPIQRMAQLMRTFGAKTQIDSFSFGIGQWKYDRSKALWQSPLGSKTVFNFYLPNYATPNTALSRQGFVSPEMQITTSASVGDTDSFFQSLLENGGITDCCDEAARNSFFLMLNYTGWTSLVTKPDLLIEKMNQRFMAGQMSPRLKVLLRRAMDDVYQDRSQTSGIIRGLPQLKFAAAMRVMLASPEYVVQK
jgi:uncharacterized protein (DUF1800 family)